MMLRRGTMHKVIATFAKLHEAHSQCAAILLDDMQHRYVTQSGPKATDAHL